MKAEWEKHLAHERVCRDALVECGNPAPTKPDPVNGLVRVEARIFNGRVFFAHLKKHGHTAATFNTCECRNK